MSRYIRNIWVLCVIATLCGCVQDDFLLSQGGEERNVTFRPALAGDAATRAIGEALLIDRFVVAVYEGDTEKVEKYVTTEDWATAQRDGVSLRLIEGHTYHILFWAECGDNTAYGITDQGAITVDYTRYVDGGFTSMEQLDAFYAVSTVTVGSDKSVNKRVELTRPLAQVNFADKGTQPQAGTHKTVVTFHNLPTSFNPFTGEVVMAANADMAFTFTDYLSETLSHNGETYYYLSSNYLFAPAMGTATVAVTLDLQNNSGTTISKLIFDGVENPLLTIEKNMKSNVYGSIVQQPQEWSVWDGSSRTKPHKNAQGSYVIDAASDVAWLCSPDELIEESSKFVQTVDIDMDNKDIASMQLPAGSTYDGGEMRIKNYRNSLFGDATRLTVTNLAVEAVDATGVEHVGVLVNTLRGSSSFSNITITDATACTNNGAAGGMVGYIERIVQKDRNETLQVTFSNCKLSNVEADANKSEGKFVGLLCGYDNQESLTFDAACEADDATRVKDYVSVYTKANQSAWVEQTISNKYDGWIGHETYRRGKITFEGVSLVPRWDGTTATAKADLLLYNSESNKYEVHSPFDLAGVRNATASPAALYLMENVDMHGQGTDGEYFVHERFTQSKHPSTDDNYFDPFSSIGFLEGNNLSIYNVALYSKLNTDRMAFILGGNDGNIHQNINLHNFCTVVPHIVGTDDGQTVDKSYGATFVLSIAGAKYTMDNIHCHGCKVFALQKTGIIAGRSASTTMATISNCSVNDCYIENYDCKEHKENFEGLVDFYSPGEIGGFIGYVHNFATITNCHVRRTTIYAFGQSDQRFMLIVTIPGRHVGQFIGDIRTSGKDKDVIKLSNCTVTETQCTKNWHQHSNCKMIGKVYYLNALGIINIDTKGTVTLDGKSIF